MKVAVLTYHSHNISGTSYPENDHVALAEDLVSLYRAGVRFVSLDAVVDAISADAVSDDGELAVGISFDDGPVFDYFDFEHRRFGRQRAFRNILDDFAASHGVTPVPATSFVIASPEARMAMERAPECGYPDVEGWLRDDWWRIAAQSGSHSIGNHSWDHVHHAPANVALSSNDRNDFTLVQTYPDADAQIRRAGEYIRAKLGFACRLFAYPFGHVNRFLAEDYLPHRKHEHGLRAAFGVAASMVPPACSPWNIPRMVCGEQWTSAAELLSLLGLTR